MTIPDDDGIERTPDGSWTARDAAGSRERAFEPSIESEFVGVQVNTPSIGNQTIIFPQFGVAAEPPIDELPEELRRLPPYLHPYRDPHHDELIRELEEHRIVLISSYQAYAAY